jgi:2-succinyl-5-enolpyruvyl-6-hydroxy-3-cyclohexene-1-carboxylate synthase
MALDYRNTNMIWASMLAETLHRLGLQTAILCPGSRSAPLAIAFAQHPGIEALSILDERSAAFFALGRAKQSHFPVAVICTSGTAGANFFPAVIEARESHVPLLILSADRPPELRHCHAGQAIDQTQLFGSYPNWYAELAMPSSEPSLLAYLRQTIVHAWERSLHPAPAPVHLNIPFREPLAPTPDLIASPHHRIDEARFFQGIRPSSLPSHHFITYPSKDSLPIHTWRDCDRGLIIAGSAIPDKVKDYCQAIAYLSQLLGWPVLAEGLSPLRNYADLNPYLIATYDIALRHAAVATELEPDIVLQIGELPTSKTLRQWLEQLQGKHWILESSIDNVDPLHHHSTHLRLSSEALAEAMANTSILSSACATTPRSANPYLKSWLTIEGLLRNSVRSLMESTADIRESKIAWMLSEHLPSDTLLFIANSMPIRDVEMFWQPGQSHIQPFFNRGANGIDGTLSTALGLSHRQQSSVLLTGDLALLHDTNGFLTQTHWKGHLTIILINNHGGGIFGMLPIAQFDAPFEEFFATPQQVDFGTLCHAYHVEYEVIQSWEALATRLNPLPNSGIRVLEIQCDRNRDAQWRRTAIEHLVSKIPTPQTG